MLNKLKQSKGVKKRSISRFQRDVVYFNWISEYKFIRIVLTEHLLIGNNSVNRGILLSTALHLSQAFEKQIINSNQPTSSSFTNWIILNNFQDFQWIFTMNMSEVERWPVPCHRSCKPIQRNYSQYGTFRIRTHLHHHRKRSKQINTIFIC